MFSVLHDHEKIIIITSSVQASSNLSDAFEGKMSKQVWYEQNYQLQSLFRVAADQVLKFQETGNRNSQAFKCWCRLLPLGVDQGSKIHGDRLWDWLMLRWDCKVYVKRCPPRKVWPSGVPTFVYNYLERNLSKLQLNCKILWRSSARIRNKTQRAYYLLSGHSN